MKSILKLPNGKLGKRYEGNTDQIEVVAILEAVEKPHNPLCPAGGMNQRSGFEKITFSADMSLLSFPQHIGLTQLEEKDIDYFG